MVYLICIKPKLKNYMQFSTGSVLTGTINFGCSC